MIELKTLRQLIKLMKDNELSELDIRDKDEQVTLKRGSGDVVHQVAPPPAAIAVPAPVAAAASAPAAAPPADSAAAQGLLEIKSPMVGTYYAAASPDAEAYVKIGARVDADSVVCIIEAMKVFNEIKAEVSGTIDKILVSTGQAVEYGQPLFLVKPD